MLFAAANGGRLLWRKADVNAPRRRSSKLPDLEQSNSAVLNSLTSASSKRSYEHATREFIDWYCSEPRLAFKQGRSLAILVSRYRIALEQHRYAPSTINLRLAAIRRLAIGPESSEQDVVRFPERLQRSGDSTHNSLPFYGLAFYLLDVQPKPS